MFHYFPIRNINDLNNWINIVKHSMWCCVSDAAAVVLVLFLFIFFFSFVLDNHTSFTESMHVQWWPIMQFTENCNSSHWTVTEYIYMRIVCILWLRLHTTYKMHTQLILIIYFNAIHTHTPMSTVRTTTESSKCQHISCRIVINNTMRGGQLNHHNKKNNKHTIFCCCFVCLVPSSPFLNF